LVGKLQGPSAGEDRPSCIFQSWFLAITIDFPGRFGGPAEEAKRSVGK